ncbi:hypothetical protein N9145_00565 [bacterium]|jgi:hypothetical protein|nr:hypothetical protein [bacterium]
MKELVAFRKHLNEGQEPQSEYKIRVMEMDESTRYMDVTLTEDFINELRDDIDFDYTWEEVQAEIKNDEFDGGEFYSSLLNAGYEPKDGQDSLNYEIHFQ